MSGAIAGAAIGYAAVGTTGAALAGAALGTAAGGYISSQKAAKAQAGAAQSAAEAQVQAAQESAQVQRDIFERQVELQEPWRKAGEQALNKLIPLSDYTPFGMSQFQADPGYAFRMSEGMKALERSAAARGGLLSGATLKGVQQYGQGLASQEYQNAFNRYQAERAARLNPLQSLAGVGQTSANALAGAAGQLGSGLAGTYGQMGQAQAAGILGAGEARASGYLGAQNTLNKALGTGLNYYQNQQLMGGGGSGDYGYGSFGTSSGYADQVAQQNALGFNW